MNSYLRMASLGAALKSNLGAALTAAAYVLWLSVGSANANTVTIQLQQDGVNGGAITTVATGEGMASISGLTYGTFASVSVTGVEFNHPAHPWSALFSSLIAASSSTPGTLSVYVSLSQALLPKSCGRGTCGGLVVSGLTVNALPIGNFDSLGWSVEEEIYITSGQSPFFNTRILASRTFDSTGSFETVKDGCGDSQSNCFGTLTEKYVVTATGPGVAVGTILLQAPGPLVGAGLPGLIAAGGLLAWWRRKRKSASSSESKSVG